MLHRTLNLVILLLIRWSEAWLFENQTHLVETLRLNGTIKSKKVEEVLLQVDRGNYISYVPYEDTPVALYYGASFSPPQEHAFILETLKDHLKEGNTVLDVGCGNGYLTACFALMVGKSGYAVGIEHMKEIYDSALRNVERGNPSLLKENRVRLIEGDGRKGVPDQGPYDAINVGAITKQIPIELLQQLKPGGRLVVQIDHGRIENLFYELLVLDRTFNGTIETSTVNATFPETYCEYLMDTKKQYEEFVPPAFEDK